MKNAFLAAQLSPAVDFCDLDGNLLIAPTADLYKGATLQNNAEPIYPE
ncbi:MAG: hypothetical protein LBJ63_00505 [Prevotellaceae bacterium]|jgi:hypothetical protein|nr:hypothetical protein [Prevotellaceae bacterium]